MKIDSICWHDGGRNEEYQHVCDDVRPIRNLILDLVKSNMDKIERLAHILFDFKKENIDIEIVLFLGDPPNYEDEPGYKIELAQHEENFAELEGHIQRQDYWNYDLLDILFIMEVSEK